MSLLTKNLADRVFKLLAEHPHLRDSDFQLLAMVWKDEVPENKHSGSVYEFLGALSDNKYTNPESIRRVRQKIQEENPHLRGKKWTGRHKKGESFKEEELNPIENHIKPQQSLLP